MQLRGGVRLGRAAAARLGGEAHLEILLQRLQEFLRREAVQVLDHAVVVDDGELALREAHGHEVVVFLVAGVVRVLGPLLGAHAGGRGGAVVAVGHVERIDLGGEDLRDPGDRGVVVNHPEGVRELVLVHELVLGFARGGFCDDGGEFRVVLEGEEDGLDVRILDADMDHAVVFLVLAGQFVLLDLAGGVVVGVGAQDEAVLGPFAHGLGVDIVLLLVVLDEPAFLPPLLEIGDGLVIGGLGVLIGDGVEVDFRLGDVQQGLLSGHGLGLGGVEDVIRRCRDLGHDVLRGTDGGKGFYAYHNYLFTWNLRLPVAKKSTIWRAAARPAFMLASAVWAPIFFGVAKTRRPNFSCRAA